MGCQEGGKPGRGDVEPPTQIAANHCDRFFLSFSFYFFFFFSNHMFIVSTVQEMTCIFNDMAKTKPKIKSTINKRNKYNQLLQRDQ